MPPPHEVIDLTLESDDEAPLPEAPAWEAQLDAVYNEQNDAADRFQVEINDLQHYRIPGQFEEPPLQGGGYLANVPLVIDDFGYLEEDAQQQAGAEQEEQDLELAHALQDQQDIVTRDDCLARVYEMFPDVCPEHTVALYDQVGAESDDELPAAIYLDRIIEKLITDETYPKRKKDTQHLKRKRTESAEDEYREWERDDRQRQSPHLTGSIRAILKADFPTFTHATINQVVAEEIYLFKSYVRLSNMRDTDANPRRGRPAAAGNADVIVANSGSQTLGPELAAARKRAREDRARRLDDMTKKRAEAENLRHAIAAGSTAECQACFDDLPMNRQVHCHGDEPHFTCLTCIETYIKTEIGDARCRILCTAGCGAGFEPAQLNLVADKKLLQKLAELQQEKDIRDAGLEGLEECPFCDYKAIMPPIEEDFEFRCANPDCEKVSCRRCKSTSHIPISCEQYANEKKANSRHTIEEAMTAALIRSCNKCKKQFIKEYGCNKMTCPSCSNLQCYVCSETLKGYDHFDQNPNGDPRPGGKCPLYDNLEQRHEREIRAAEETARAQVIANNPDVALEDLEIKVSDAVKKSTEQKIQRAGPEGLGGGPNPWGGGGRFLNVINAWANEEEMNEVLGDRDVPLPRRHGPPAERLPLGGADDIGEDAAARNRHRLAAAQRQRAVRQAQHLQEHQRAQLRRQNRMLEARERLIANEALHNAQLQQPNDGALGWVDAYNNLLGRVGNAINLPIYGAPPLVVQPQPQPQPQAQPAAVAMANIQRQLLQGGPVPNGFVQRPPVQRNLQAAFNDARAPPAAQMPDPNAQLNRAGMANVMRNLHQLELLRQQHDARQGNVPEPVVHGRHRGRRMGRGD